MAAYQASNRLETEDRITHGHVEGRSITGLLKELRDETTHLFRAEVQLAKTEVRENAMKAGRNAGYLAAGGMIAFAGLLVLLFAAVVGLYVLFAVMGMDREVAGWLSPLIIGASVAGIGYALIQKAISTFRRGSFAPDRTVRTMNENKDWVKEKVS
ncbi:MAG: phage holin family protein [Planctomycetaceae bacterium]